MTIGDIKKLLEAEILVGENCIDFEVNSACGSDMMSDVLAYVKDHSILLTGLINPQVIRTAEMMDMRCIVFVRGKVPDESVLELARQKDFIILATKQRLYTACGILYHHGLRGAGCDKV
jgi:predicted transcriptional regulator